MRKLTVELTSRCRLQCPKCARTIIGRDLQIYDLPVDDLRKIASTCTHEVINLTGNVGDAIYHPNFFECIDAIKDCGKNFELYTNGSGKDRSFWRRLYESMEARDRVVFSIDGLADTAGIYRVGFKPSDFDLVLSAMKLGVDMGVNVAWFFIPFRHNEHQIKEAALTALSIGASFHVKMSNRWTDESDPMMPVNRKLISPESRFIRKACI